MEGFFGARASGYEQQMRRNVKDLNAFYDSISEALPSTTQSPRILDLGVGTGLELDALFKRFPSARVKGIDLSRQMLAELVKKDPTWLPHVELVIGSFLDLDLGHAMYDAVISAMALHHWIPNVKLSLYRRVHRALMPGGVFVNADYVESADESSRRLDAYQPNSKNDEHLDHLDLPLTSETEVALLKEAGFHPVRVAFRQPRAVTLLACT